MAQTFDQLVRAFNGASNLPQPSKSPLRLSALLESGDPSPAEIEAIVHSDPALTAGLLKTASAAAFGRTRPVGSIREAVMVLGFRALRSVAIALWTQALVCEGKHKSRLDLVRFSTGSYFTGILASELSSVSPEPKGEGAWSSEEVFAFGVLGRLGVGLLSLLAPDEFDRVYAKAESDKTSLETAFQALHGRSLHELALVGARSMALPESLCAALETLSTGQGLPGAVAATSFVTTALQVADSNGMGIGKWDVSLDLPDDHELAELIERAKASSTGTLLKSA
ncbi:MAG: HDOD domain-containing protein [Armatimonadetes bacterium]|nr:HDOD domain-containing protein [Armatimonadota bacterium]